MTEWTRIQLDRELPFRGSFWRDGETVALSDWRGAQNVRARYVAGKARAWVRLVPASNKNLTTFRLREASSEINMIQYGSGNTDDRSNIEHGLVYYRISDIGDDNLNTRYTSDLLFIGFTGECWCINGSLVSGQSVHWEIEDFYAWVALMYHKFAIKLQLQLPIAIESGVEGIMNYKFIIPNEKYQFNSFSRDFIVLIGLIHGLALDEFIVHARAVSAQIWENAGLERPNDIEDPEIRKTKYQIWSGWWKGYP